MQNDVVGERRRVMAKWIKKPVYHGDDTSGYVDPNWTCSYCGGKAPVDPYWGIYDLVENCPHCGMIMTFTREEKSDEEVN